MAEIVLGTTEQTVADTARELLWPDLELEDSPEARNWRRAWAYSRITTIYGGAVEVQRDLVAERLLEEEDQPCLHARRTPAGKVA